MTVGKLMAIAALMLVTPAFALAQDGGGADQPVSISLDQADIRDALRALFRMVGLNYVVNSDVVGTVTVSLNGVPFTTALRNLLNQVDATYRIEAGVYQIVRKEVAATGGGTFQEQLPTTTATQQWRPIFLSGRDGVLIADPAYILALLGGNDGTGQFPEQTSTIGIQSGGGGFGGGNGGGFGGGGFGGGGGGFGGGGFGGGSGGFGGGSGGGFGGGSGGFGGGGGGFGR